MSPITGYEYFDQLTKMLSARLVHYKVILFLSVINKFLMGENIKTM